MSKHSRLLAALIIGLIAYFAIDAGFTFAYVTDGAIHLPSGYTTFSPPSVGGSYTDAVFGTAIKRLSDSMHTPDIARGGVVTTIENEYSTMSAFNSDSTRLLIQHFSYFALYDGNGNFIRNLLQYGISASTEPRWSRTDPYVFYYVAGNQLRAFNVGTLTISVVRTFSEYTRIRGEGESDIAFDGNSLVLAGDHRYIFVYDIATDTKGPALDAGTNGFDNMYLTPDKHVLVGWYANGLNRFNGVEMYDKNMNFLRQIAHAMGHMDVTRDTAGEEVAVWANAADAQLQVPCEAGVTKIRLSDGKQTCVFKGDWDWHVAYHISAPDNSGWFFMESYAPRDPIPPAGWYPYTNEILQVRLDGTEIRRLAHHRSRPFTGNTYVYTPRVSANRDGTKLVYSSNFGLQSILGYPTNYSDVYMIDVPPAPPAATTITWSNPADIAYGTALGSAQLNATASSNGNSVAGTFVYTPPAGTVLNAGAGQALHVEFTPTDTVNYSAASKDVAINVIKASQTITFGPLANKTYGDPPFTVSATASSGLPVSFSASGSCTVSNNTVTITAAGSCTITAHQAGNDNYYAAADVARSFTISAITTASDNFNRPDGVLGPNWSGLGGGSLIPVIRSSRAGTDSSYTSNRTARYSGIVWGTNQSSQIGFPALPYKIGMAAVRMQSNANSYYAGGFDNNNFSNSGGTYRCRIVRYTNGALTSLALDNTCVIQAGDTVKLEAQGTTLRLYVNGVLRLTASDSAYSSGSPGFTFNYNQTNASIVDNWVGATLP